MPSRADDVRPDSSKQTRLETNERPRTGLGFTRKHTIAGRHPFDAIEWERRTAQISSEGGQRVFEQTEVEVPASWSQLATNVVVSKYFHGRLGTAERETSVRQLVGRVAGTIATWGRQQGVFADESDALVFEHELTHLLVEQKAAFNSPVWFNVGVEARPQCSACFINSVQDTMPSILELAATEGMLFKYGSGSGTNFSTLRSSKESLSGGGTASGPVSFMKGFDAFAGVIKSGGRTRRAAKMVILDVAHPDIVPFIRCKADEEKKAWALIDAGYDGSLSGEAYDSVFFQNSNNSVRVTDAFMRAVESDGTWQTRAVATGEVAETLRARTIFRAMAEATWVCGDPGIQFDDTINSWHTCPETAPIRASNPCSEYMFLDDTACNLASVNLMRFRTQTGDLDVDALRHAVRILIVAQELLVDAASYPTARIERNSHDYRPLGLGFANLGTFLMARGYPYDSDPARHIAAAITAVLSGHAYAVSAELSAALGPFPGWAANAQPMNAVISRHRQAVGAIDPTLVPEILLGAARESWREAEETGRRHGFRHAQVTVLAPTGTIGFMMDCDTMGIEPDIALIKYKRLSGGGFLEMVNRAVSEALERLGYDSSQRRAILAHLEREETIEGAPHLEAKDLEVFDCAFRPRRGVRSIAPMGHVRMMAAVQPFLSGAISKTVNLPRDASVEEIERVYLEAWKSGLKAVAVYRDGCKRTQPLSTSRTSEGTTLTEVPARGPSRRRLADERRAVTHKFSVGGHEGYFTVGLYEDETPGEIFLVMAKQGSVVSGLCDAFATSVSLALQYGVPLQALVEKFVNTRFEPAGITNNPDLRIATSITDYVFRWLAQKFLPGHPAARRNASTQLSPENSPLVSSADDTAQPARSAPPTPPSTGGAIPTGHQAELDAPSCSDCGSLMTRNGSCYRCLQCGETSGCS